MAATDAEVIVAATELIAALRAKEEAERQAVEAMQRWQDAGQAQVNAESQLAEAVGRVGTARAALRSVLTRN